MSRASLRQALPLAGWGCVLAFLLLYLAHASAKSGTYWPGEEALLERMGRFLLTVKPRYDGTLASASRQDVLILQTGLFFLPATAAFLMAVRAALRCELPARQALAAIVAGSALLRILIVPAAPALETDHHRYLWDGAVTFCGMNPYQFAPQEVSNWTKGKNRELYAPRELELLTVLARLSSEPELADRFARINHPSVPTVYPPVAQALFGLTHALAPGNVTVLKALVAGVDMLVVLAVAALLGMLGRDPRWAIGYGWCPLILKEYAGTGHYDPLAVLFTLTGLAAAMERRAVAAGFLIGVATLSKLYPAILLPVLWRRLRASGLVAFTLTLVAGWGSFLGIGPRVLDGLFAFGTNWEFNSSLVALAESALKPLVPGDDPLMLSIALSRKLGQQSLFFTEQAMDAFLCAKLLAACCMVVLLLYMLRLPDADSPALAARSGIAIAALLALSPVADPWYFGWIAPFACIFPGAAAAWLSWGMSLYYFYFLVWRYPWWSRPLEYLPCYALLIRDVAGWRGRGKVSP